MRNERLSLIGTTISSIVHDMNNPISCILCACEVIRKNNPDGLTSEAAELIRDAIRKMETMTRELIDFSRGHTQLNYEATGVRDLNVRDQPEYAPAWSRLGLIDAGLGRKDDAILEGRHACELLPVSKDAVDGPYYIINLAMIYAWTGEKDLALEQLAIAARIPGGVTYGELKLYPQWDSLRDNPRFEKIVASLAPKR
jgi:tetratricopeptide (TPR) repeat protein